MPKIIHNIALLAYLALVVRSVPANTGNEQASMTGGQDKGRQTGRNCLH